MKLKELFKLAILVFLGQIIIISSVQWICIQIIANYCTTYTFWGFIYLHQIQVIINLICKHTPKALSVKSKNSR